MRFPDIRALFVRSTDSLKKAANCINSNRQGLAALVVDEQQKLIDVVTDGDIRRAILDGLSLETPVSALRRRKEQGGYPKPITACMDTAPSEQLALMRSREITQLPLVDDEGRVVDIVKLVDLLPEASRPVQAVVMAGGFGTRLYPLTVDMPKPMLPVGDRPLLELTIANLKAAGIHRVSVTTHFQSEKIQEHFGDGSDFGVEIRYLNEDAPLGTAGALSMLGDVNEPLLVINGDVLTQVDFQAMQMFHREHRAELTVAVRQYDLQVPFGVMECDGAIVTSVREKPVYNFFVNAGIYLMEPAACQMIPSGRRFDMPDLINDLIAANRSVVSFPIVEYWLDIGQHLDYAQAQKDIVSSIFKR